MGRIPPPPQSEKKTRFTFLIKTLLKKQTFYRITGFRLELYRKSKILCFGEKRDFTF